MGNDDVKLLLNVGQVTYASQFSKWKLFLTSFFFLSSSFLFFSSLIWANRCFLRSNSAFSSLLSDMAETLINRNHVTVWLLLCLYFFGVFLLLVFVCLFCKIAAFLSRSFPQRNCTSLPKPAYQKPEKSTIIEKTHIPISIFFFHLTHSQYWSDWFKTNR